MLRHPYGILIVVEGIDGSGKSTLCRMLADYLMAHNIPTLQTREPGGSSFGKQIRALVQTQKALTCPKAEYLLFAADRAQHIHEVVEPHLAQGYVVISDRMTDSSIAYQGYGHGLDIASIKAINTWTMGTVQPTITFYLRITVEEAQKRIALRADEQTRFEKTEFQQRVFQAFESMYKNRDNVVYLDAMKQPEELVLTAYKALTNYIPGALKD